jgi:hypothetical protein
MNVIYFLSTDLKQSCNLLKTFGQLLQAWINKAILTMKGQLL